MNSLYYFKEEISKHLELTGDIALDTRNYYKAVEEGNKDLKAIRQKGKGPSFGLQYGAYPAKIAASIKCSLEEAEQIFSRYHNELYPGVTAFRENYVHPTASKEGRLHMGLGCYINTDDPDRDIRTITNSCSQFWSILTLLAINKLHQLIDENDLQNKVKVVSSIYDSLYIELDKDPVLIKWLNDTLVPIMQQDFIVNQKVPNEATGEVGYDWATMIQIPHNASTEQIIQVLKELDQEKYNGN